ncbi:hypothetical protein WDK70_22565, partial [Escherichia coli]
MDHFSSVVDICGQSFWLAVQGMFSGYRVPQSRDIAPIVTFQIDRGLKMCKRAARTVLTGMCYSVGSATRQGSSSPTRFIGQSAMT